MTRGGGVAGAGAPRRVALLRGINLGPHRRISMLELRERLTAAGYENVRTLLQSGNIVLGSELQGAPLERRLSAQIHEWFDLQVPVLTRTAAELAKVVADNPLSDLATEPKRLQVSFFTATPDRAVVESLQALVAGDERLIAAGRQIYAWHPDGVARSKLAAALAQAKLGATARNWATVTKLAEMARG